MIALQRARRMYLDNETAIGLISVFTFVMYLVLRHV